MIEKKIISSDDKEREKTLLMAAKKSLSKLKIYSLTTKEFLEDGIVNYSQNGGVLYWATEEMKEKIKRIESDNNIKVYHIIKGTYLMSDNEKLEMEDYLYVSLESSSGILDEYKGSMIVMSWSDNLSWDIQEYGSIGVKSQIGGLIRTY